MFTDSSTKCCVGVADCSVGLSMVPPVQTTEALYLDRSPSPQAARVPEGHGEPVPAPRPPAFWLQELGGARVVRALLRREPGARPARRRRRLSSMALGGLVLIGGVTLAACSSSSSTSASALATTHQKVVPLSVKMVLAGP